MNRTTRCLLVCCLLLGSLLLLAVTPQQQGVQAIITSPQPNATVMGLVVIKGSANINDFQFYKVEFGRGPNPTDWHLIGATQPVPVIDGVLAQWDTTGLPDGVYSLRLQVVKQDGNYQEYPVYQVVVANKRPTETPTVEPTPEDTPVAETPAPGPTATLAIVQPTAVIAQPTATPTPVRPMRGVQMPELPIGTWRQALCLGAGTMAAIFAVVGLTFALRRIL